jgi:hypothetical protein
MGFTLLLLCGISFYLFYFIFSMHVNICLLGSGVCKLWWSCDDLRVSNSCNLDLAIYLSYVGSIGYIAGCGVLYFLL